ncbi:MAG TPA: bile acid:sodium symporter, partial [Caulobacteraceae bacterium]
ALNITLTAINSVLAIVTLPIIVSLSMWHFMGQGEAIPLQFAKVIQVFAIVLIPVAVGMLVNARATRAAEAMRRPMKWISVIFLVSVIAFAGSQDSGNIGEFIMAVGAACLAFNLASLGIGYGLPRLLKLEQPQAIAIGMEVGIHNSTLAITVAMSPLMLGEPEMAIPAAVYGVMMLFTAAGFGWLVNRGRPVSAG